MFKIKLEFDDSEGAITNFEQLSDFINTTLHMTFGGWCETGKIKSWCAENAINPVNPGKCIDGCDRLFQPCTPEIRQRVVDWCTEKHPTKMVISEIMQDEEDV